RAGAGARPGAGARRGGAPGPGPDVGFEAGPRDDIDLDDLLGGFFGGGGGRGRRGWGPIPGADQEAELTLTVEEAYRGGRRRISIDGRDLDVTVPAGVVDGQRIRLAGQGGQGTDGAAPGDL